MGIIWTILIGALVGMVARFFHPGNDPGGWIITPLIGIGGSVVANYLGRLVGWYAEGEVAGFIASVLGAILILIVVRMVKGKSA